MELTALITILGVFIANAVVIVPLFLWRRAESRSDTRSIEEILLSTRDLVRAIHDEVKDFHERLINLENRRK